MRPYVGITIGDTAEEMETKDTIRVTPDDALKLGQGLISAATSAWFDAMVEAYIRERQQGGDELAVLSLMGFQSWVIAQREPGA